MNPKTSKFTAGAAKLTSGRNLFKVGAVATAITAAGIVSGQAQVLFYEGVPSTYSGDLGGNGPWTGGGGVTTIQPGAFTYTDGLGNSLVTEGNSHIGVGGYYSGGATADITPATPDSNGNSTFYVSFLASNASNDGNIQLTDTTETIEGGRYNGQDESFQITPESGSGSVSFGTFTNQDGAGRSGGSSSVTASSGVALDVFEFQYNATANTETVTGWVNPTLGLQPGTSDYSQTLTLASSIAGFDPNEISFGAQFYSNLSFDEIRVGDTYADVTPISEAPEPSTWALMLGGLLSLFAFRRNRSAKV